MTNNKPSKSFSFTVAKSPNNTSKLAKARNGVAVAGCTMYRAPWGLEPRGTHWVTSEKDQGVWC